MVTNSKNDKRADALRANLRRRKEQERSLKQAPGLSAKNGGNIALTKDTNADTKNKDA